MEQNRANSKDDFYLRTVFIRMLLQIIADDRDVDLSRGLAVVCLECKRVIYAAKETNQVTQGVALGAKLRHEFLTSSNPHCVTVLHFPLFFSND